MNTHPDDETLEAYAMRMLARMEAAGLERHLLGCRRCRGRLVEMGRYVRAMAAAARRWRRGQARCVKAFSSSFPA